MLKIRALHRAGLEPVDLDVAAGQCAIITGPSGGGKTLLLRAIADLDQNSGVVSLDGTPRASMPAPEWRRAVGYVAAELGEDYVRAIHSPLTHRTMTTTSLALTNVEC